MWWEKTRGCRLGWRYVHSANNIIWYAELPPVEQLDYSPQLNDFLKWTRSLVAQFISRQTLERQARRFPGVSVEVTILQVSPLTYKMTTWARLLDAVRQSLQTQVTDKDEFSQVLQTFRDWLINQSNATLPGEGSKTLLEITYL